MPVCRLRPALFLSKSGLKATVRTYSGRYDRFCPRPGRAAAVGGQTVLIWSGHLSRAVRSLVASLVMLSLAATPLVTAMAAVAVTPADYAACQAKDDEAFRKAIEAVTTKALTQEMKSVDYEAAVIIEWRRLDLDQIIDTRVDAAVEEVRSEQSFGSLIKSLGSEEKAQELAVAVADHTYRSKEMRTAIENLASAVGTEVGKRIEIANQDAAGPALACLKTFLGPRYGETVAGAVAADAGREFGIDANKGTAELASGSVLRHSGQGITGAAILILRRQMANMARRLGQRLAGSVLARLVSVVAGGVGIALIAKDLWDLRHGVLPIVGEEMKSKETKDKVRQEITAALAQEIERNVQQIGATTAQQVVDVWQEFKRAHAKALELAEQDQTFRRFLDTVDAASFARLDEVVSLLLASEGEDAILKRAGDGSLDEAVNRLPEAGMTIARETGSVATALAWSAIAGQDIARVADYGVHKHATPDSFTSRSLTMVLDLNDRVAVTSMAELGPQARDILFTLPQGQLRSLARNLEPRELQALAAYVKSLEPGPRERILNAASDTPALMGQLASERVRNAIITSRDQAAAVDMLLRPPGAPISATADDLKAVWEGRIEPVLFWEKHPLAVGIGVVLGLVILLWLKRLVFPARRTPKASPGSA